MKNIKTSNRFSPYLDGALLALCLALVTGIPAQGVAPESQGKIIHPAFNAGAPHLCGKTSGLRCDWFSWLRRPPWVF
jgi:hypothetical protein